MKMKIIGHRGVPSLELENTAASIKKAIELGVPMIEFDVHITRDRRVVLSHDASLGKLGGGDFLIADTTYAELQKHPLRNGEPVPLLSTVMEIVGPTPVIIEIKVLGAVQLVLDVIDAFPAAQVSIASPIYSQIAELKQLRPHLPGYIRVVTNPFDGFYTAKGIGADGLDLNFWLLNPLTYFMCRHSNMQLMVYTVNFRLLVRFIHLLYPKAMICTNYPQYYVPHKKLLERLPHVRRP